MTKTTSTSPAQNCQHELPGLLLGADSRSSFSSATTKMSGQKRHDGDELQISASKKRVRFSLEPAPANAQELGHQEVAHANNMTDALPKALSPPRHQYLFGRATTTFVTTFSPARGTDGAISLRDLCAYGLVHSKSTPQTGGFHHIAQRRGSVTRFTLQRVLTTVRQELDADDEEDASNYNSGFAV